MFVIFKDSWGCSACYGDITIIGTHPLNPQGLVDKLNKQAADGDVYYIVEVPDLSKYSREEALEVALKQQ